MTRSRELTRDQPFIVFGRPQIEEEEIAEVVASLRTGWLGTGPKVTKFEQDFKLYKHAAHAIGLNSCTAALQLSVLAAGIGPGDEVLTTAMTFCATVNAIIHAGATPVLVDIDAKTMNLDCQQLATRINGRTRAVVPVHFGGRPCDMTALAQLAAKHNLLIIEDCAHAVEAEYRGKQVGTFGALGCFSFYATKNLTTGEGGMVLTESDEIAARIRRLALHGMSADAWRRFSDEGYHHYEVVECGYKFNMMDLQAAIGIHQLRRLNANWCTRRQYWNTYTDLLGHLPVELPPEPESGTKHAYHLYTIMVDEKRSGLTRDRFLEAMTARGVGVGVHYRSIPEHPYYQKTFGWKAEDYPVAMDVGRKTVSIPLSAAMTSYDIERVARTIGDVFAGS